jgi:hypothetical protein
VILTRRWPMTPSIQGRPPTARVESVDRIDVAGGNHAAERDGGGGAGRRRKDEGLAVERVRTRIGQIGGSSDNTQRAAPVGARLVAWPSPNKPVGACSTWLAIDFAVSTSFCSEVMPVLAACSTCTPLPMPSSRLLMSLARLSSPAR